MLCYSNGTDNEIYNSLSQWQRTLHFTLSYVVKVNADKERMISNPVVVQTILGFRQQWTDQLYCSLWHSTIAAWKLQTILNHATSNTMRRQDAHCSVSEWVSSFMSWAWYISGHFGDKSFQAITCTGIDNSKQTGENTLSQSQQQQHGYTVTQQFPI